MTYLPKNIIVLVELVNMKMPKSQKFSSGNDADLNADISARNRALKLAEIMGSNIRQKRISMGLTQADLGIFIGLSYQQIQKYESGKSVASAVQLFDLSQFMKMPIAYFFQGLSNKKSCILPESNSSQIINGNQPSAAEISKLISSFSAIRNKQLRKLLLQTLEEIGEA